MSRTETKYPGRAIRVNMKESSASFCRSMESPKAVCVVSWESE